MKGSYYCTTRGTQEPGILTHVHINFYLLIAVVYFGSSSGSWDILKVFERLKSQWRRRWR